MVEEIIIDGIDVNKCEFAEIFNNKCICNCIMAVDCKRIPKKVINIYCEDK